MNYTAGRRKIIFAALAVLPLFTALICLGFGRYALGLFDTVRIRPVLTYPMQTMISVRVTGDPALIPASSNAHQYRE